MIWLILGFFLQAFCSLPYLNTSLVGSNTKGRACYSFILEPWRVFNQVDHTMPRTLQHNNCVLVVRRCGRTWWQRICGKSVHIPK